MSDLRDMRDKLIGCDREDRTTGEMLIEGCEAHLLTEEEYTLSRMIDEIPKVSELLPNKHLSDSSIREFIELLDLADVPQEDRYVAVWVQWPWYKIAYKRLALAIRTWRASFTWGPW